MSKLEKIVGTLSAGMSSMKKGIRCRNVYDHGV